MKTWWFEREGHPNGLFSKSSFQPGSEVQRGQYLTLSLFNLISACRLEALDELTVARPQ